MQITTTVAAIPDGGNATATLQGQMYPSKLLRVTLNGPSGSRAELYLGGQRFDQTARGQSNTAEYPNAVEVPGGTPVSVRWIGQSNNYAACNASFTVER